MQWIKVAASASVLGVFALGLASLPAQANLVLNSSFEEAGPLPGSGLICPISDWSTTCDGKTGEAQNIDPVLHGHASYLAIGSDSGLNFVSQVIPTVAGHTYNFKFDFTSDGATGNHFQVLWDSLVLVDAVDTSFDSDWTDSGLTVTSIFTLTAPTSSTTIAFGGQGNGTSFIGVDDVSVNDISSVPEPGPLALFAIGIVGLGFVRRKRAASHPQR